MRIRYSAFMLLAAVAMLWFVLTDRKCNRTDCTPECAHENGCF